MQSIIWFDSLSESGCYIRPIETSEGPVYPVYPVLHAAELLVFQPPPPVLTCVLSCSRTWPLSALDVSVLAALWSCRQHELQPVGYAPQKCILFFFFRLKVLSPCGFHATASCVMAWLLRASLLSHNEHQTAELYAFFISARAPSLTTCCRAVGSLTLHIHSEM